MTSIAHHGFYATNLTAIKNYCIIRFRKVNLRVYCSLECNVLSFLMITHCMIAETNKQYIIVFCQILPEDHTGRVISVLGL